jgi:hypothetical protein
VIQLHLALESLPAGPSCAHAALQVPLASPRCGFMQSPTVPNVAVGHLIIRRHGASHGQLKPKARCELAVSLLTALAGLTSGIAAWLWYLASQVDAPKTLEGSCVGKPHGGRKSRHHRRLTHHRLRAGERTEEHGCGAVERNGCGLRLPRGGAERVCDMAPSHPLHVALTFPCGGPFGTHLHPLGLYPRSGLGVSFG